MSATASKGVTRCSSPLKKSITIETRTSSKILNIEWVINKETLDIAKLSPQKNKKGVISTTMQYGVHTLHFELCLTGWKRSHRDHSAFYFTVLPGNTSSTAFSKEEEFKESPREFVAKYSISFTNGTMAIVRNSSIREDFDLGVGFPNFTDQSTLLEAVRDDKLVLHIQIEIFERTSRVRQLLSVRQPQNAVARMMARMFYEKQNTDAVIVVQHDTKYSDHSDHRHSPLPQPRRIKVHRCVLAAVSPVFSSLFKQQRAENKESVIEMPFDEEMVMTMVRFLYLGRIEFEKPPEGDAVRYQYGNLKQSESLSADEMALDIGSLGLDAIIPDSERMGVSGPEERKCPLEEVKRDEIGDEEKQRTKFGNMDTPRGTPSRKTGWECLGPECPERVRKLFALFQIGECYEIEGLLVSCCYELKEAITLSSCLLLLLHVVKWEHIEDVKKISEFLLEYAVKNIKAIKKMDSYQYVLKHKPELIDTIIDRLADREDNRIIV